MDMLELKNINYTKTDVQRILEEHEESLKWVIDNWDVVCNGSSSKGIKELELSCIDAQIVINCLRKVWTNWED